MSNPMTAPTNVFLYTLRPTRLAALTDGPTAEEAAVVGRHWAYTQALLADGVLIFAGRTLVTTEDSVASVVIRAASEQAAREIMEGDPAVQAGFFRAQLFPYQAMLMGSNGRFQYFPQPNLWPGGRVSQFYADTIEPVERSTDDELFLIRLVAEPKRENPEANECGGAYVNVWVNTATLREAEESAIAAIQEDGWQPLRLDHWEIVCRDCYAESEDSDEDMQGTLDAVEDAFESGLGLVFYTWPLVEEDE